jgi:hypothetical protein
MKAAIFSIICAWSIMSNAQLTYIPDDAFEQYLETQLSGMSNGTPNDNYVNTSGVEVCGVIDINGNQFPIQNLIGIENFPSLVAITFTNILFTSLDLSSLISNPYVIQIENCPLLSHLKLPSSDNWAGISINNNNSLVSIEFGPNSTFSNGIIGESITLSIVNNGSLTAFDISTVPMINTGILQFIGNSSLKCLNLQNGATALWTGAQILNNDVLSCVQVDNPTFCENAQWMWANSTTADPTTSFFSTNCSNCLSSLNAIDGYFFNIYPNPTSSSITIEIPDQWDEEVYEVYDQFGRNLMSGILSSTQNILQLPFGTGIYYLKIRDEVVKVQVVR